MQKKSILKILGKNDKNIKFRKIWGVVLVSYRNIETTLEVTFDRGISFNKHTDNETEAALRSC